MQLLNSFQHAVRPLEHKPKPSKRTQCFVKALDIVAPARKLSTTDGASVKFL